MMRDATESGGRLCALALVVLVWTTPVQADPICSLVRSLLAAESSSQAVLATDDAAAADRLIDDLDLRLQRISDYAYEIRGRGDNGRGPPAPITDFIRSRARLVEIHRGRGLTAAQAEMRTPAYLALAQGVRDAMPSREVCGQEALSLRPEHGSEPLRPRPDSDATRRGGILASLSEQAELLLPGIRSKIIAIVAFVAGILGIVLASQTRRRRAKRYACNIQTTLRLSGTERAARIVDISRSGARLAVDNSCGRGDEGEICLSGKYRAVTVMWANPHFAGVKFKEQLILASKDLAELST